MVDLGDEAEKYPGLSLCKHFSWVVFCPFPIGSEDLSLFNNRLPLSLNWFGEKVVLPVKGTNISNGLVQLPGTDHTAHDLARTRLRQARCKLKFVRHCQGTDCRTHVQLEFLASSSLA